MNLDNDGGDKSDLFLFEGNDGGRLDEEASCFLDGIDEVFSLSLLTVNAALTCSVFIWNRKPINFYTVQKR